MNDFFSVLDDFALEEFVAMADGDVFDLDVASDSSGTAADEDNESYLNDVHTDKADATEDNPYVWKNGDSPFSGSTSKIVLKFKDDIDPVEGGGEDGDVDYYPVDIRDVESITFDKNVTSALKVETRNGKTFEITGDEGTRLTLSTGNLSGGVFADGDSTISISQTDTVAYKGDAISITLSGVEMPGDSEDLTPDEFGWVAVDNDIQEINIGGTGSVTVKGDYDFSVDGHAIKVGNVDTTAEHEVKFSYDDDGNIELDLSDLVVSDANKPLNVVDAGDADTLIPPTGTNNIKIGGDTYTYTLADGSEGYFELDDEGEVTGFGLGTATDSITVAKDQAIKVFDVDDPDNDLVSVDGSNYTITRTANGTYTLTVRESAEVTIGTTELDFNINKTLTGSNVITVTFDDEGVITASTISKLANGDSVTVNGVAGDELPINGTNGIVSVDDGDFTFTGGKTPTIAIAPGATLNSAYPATAWLVTTTGSGSVTDSDDNTYTYDGDGHFIVKNNVITGYDAQAGDTVEGLSTSDPITVSYNGTEATLPTVEDTDGKFSVEFDSEGNPSISGLTVGSKVTDAAGDEINTTTAGDKIPFDPTNGNINGFTPADNSTGGTLPFHIPVTGRSLTIGLETITILPAAAEIVLITYDVSGVVSVSGLNPGDVVGNAAPLSEEEREDTVFEFATTRGTTDDNPDLFYVNGVTYKVVGDTNGLITINGKGEVGDLDAGAHIHIDTTNALYGDGTASVNGVAYNEDEVTVTQLGELYNINGFTKKDRTLGSFQSDPFHPLITASDGWKDVASKLIIAGSLQSAPAAIIGEVDSADATEMATLFGANYSTLPAGATNFDYSTGEHVNDRMWVFLNNSDTRNVTFNNAGNNLAIVSDTADGDKNIVLGDKGDFVIMDGDAEYNGVTITGGAGNDNIVVMNTEATTIDLSKGGNDRIHTFAAANANITLNNYDETSQSGVVIHDPEIGHITELDDAIEEGLLTFEDGKIFAIDRDEAVTGADRKSEITVNNKNKKHQTMVRLYGYRDRGDSYGDDDGQLVGFTGKSGGILDASNIDENVVLLGNVQSTNNTLVNGNHNAGSSLKTGAGDDTVYGGGGDTIDAGKGANSVKLIANDDDRDAATVILGEGRTTIQGLRNGFADGDVLNVDLASSDTELSFEDGVLTVESKSDKFSAVAAADTVYADKGFIEQLFLNDGETIRAAIANENGTIAVEDGTAPTYYVAKNGAVDFSAYTGDVTVDMDGDWTQTAIGGDNATVSSATSLIGGSGNTLFKGGSADETLVAGTGENSIYGGGGKNQLTGQRDNEDKVGSTEFFVLGINNGAQNTISGFEFIENGGENQATFDALTINMGETGVTDIKTNTDGSVSIAVQGNGGNGGATEKVTIEEAAGKEFLVDRGTESETVAQIAATENTINNSYVDFYTATEKNATVKIGDVASAKVWLEAPDFSDGVEFVGDYTVIDARGSNAAVEMAGNDVSNTIYGGLGNASMWGGAGNANDVMYGGSAHNEFYFEAGNGQDTIMSANDGDIIHLGVAIDQIDFDNTNITSTGVEVALTDGSKLTINSTAEVSFSLDDGTAARVNRQTQQFE